MLYRLEQRIHTLAKNFVGSESMTAPEFTAEGVTFSSWQRQPSMGMWTNMYWVATAEIDASNYREACNCFGINYRRAFPEFVLSANAIRNISVSRFLLGEQISIPPLSDGLNSGELPDYSSGTMNIRRLGRS